MISLLRQLFLASILTAFSSIAVAGKFQFNDSTGLLVGLGTFNGGADGAILGVTYDLEVDYQLFDNTKLHWSGGIFSPPQLVDDVQRDFIFERQGERYIAYDDYFELDFGYRYYNWSNAEFNSLTNFFAASQGNPFESFAVPQPEPLALRLASFVGDNTYIEAILNRSERDTTILSRSGVFSSEVFTVIDDQDLRYFDSEEGDLDAGIKVSFPVAGWETNWFAYQGFNRSPIFDGILKAFDDTQYDRITQVYSRKNILGFNLTGTAFATTWKMEVINIEDEVREQFDAEKKYYRSMVGFEKTVFDDGGRSTFVVEYLRDSRKKILLFESFMRENLFVAVNTDFNDGPFDVSFGFQDAIGSSSFMGMVNISGSSIFNFLIFAGKISDDDEYFFSSGRFSGIMVTVGEGGPTGF